MPKVLELFKGSGSITTYFSNTDYEVISLDILKKYNPTICSDIMEWDYTIYPPHHFDIIWASPECKIFSMLQNTWIGRKWRDKQHLQETRDEHSCFILKTMEIIDYFKPKHYFVENPKDSKIWDYIPDEFKDKYIIVDYCFFGYDYKKPTKILTNKDLTNKRCSCKKHGMRLGLVGCKMENCETVEKVDNTTLLQRYSIPPKLLDYLFS
tara:strand:- start:284 stop:910 length:627 start_codon:yes stop_codon:yes gene_type:complete